MNNLSKDIAKAIQTYTKEVTEEVEKAKKQVSKELVTDLKADSPELTGSYKEGWRTKKVDNSFIVHNRTDYQLTHLLEYGHQTKDGGRLAPQVHIRPNEEKAVKAFLDRVEKAVKK